MADSLAGLPQMLQKFAALKTAVRNRIARIMVARAARIVRNEAKAIAIANGLRLSGALVKNIAMKRDKDAPDGTVQYNVGVRHGRELTQAQKSKGPLKINKAGRIVLRDDPWYYFLHEKTGAKPHNVARGANASAISLRKSIGKKRSGLKIHPGFKARPFLLPALERKRGEALDEMDRAFMEEVAKLP